MWWRMRAPDEGRALRRCWEEEVGECAGGEPSSRRSQVGAEVGVVEIGRAEDWIAEIRSWQTHIDWVKGHTKSCLTSFFLWYRDMPRLYIQMLFNILPN